MGGARGGGGKGHKGQSHQSILTQATVYRLLTESVNQLYCLLNEGKKKKKNQYP